MLTKLYNKSLAYFSTHAMLNSITHSLGGFGIAILLQEYLVGNPFISVCIGWACIIFSIVVHVRSFTK